MCEESPSETLTPKPTNLRSEPTNLRSEIVAAAASQVGLSDKAPYCEVACIDPNAYNWPKYWCSSFNLWVYITSGLKVVRIQPKSSEWYFSRQFKTTKDPQPGDTAYFNKNQHHAIVERVDGDDIYLINGNGMGGKVTRSVTRKSAVTVFYSIEEKL